MSDILPIIAPIIAFVLGALAGEKLCSLAVRNVLIKDGIRWKGGRLVKYEIL